MIWVVCLRHQTGRLSVDSRRSFTELTKRPMIATGSLFDDLLQKQGKGLHVLAHMCLEHHVLES